MAKRQKVLGMPIGPRKRSFPVGKVGAGVGAAGATALVAVPAVRKGMRAVEKGRQVAEKGHEVADQAAGALETAGKVKDAVSSHSSTVGKAAGLVGAVTHLGGKGGDGKPKLSHLIEEHTDVSVPRSVAYNQWTQMEMFPRITKGVDSVDTQSDAESQWTSKIGPLKRQWKARITEQVPDERIAWKSEGGPEHEGVVTFHSLDDSLTRVLVQMQYKPHGPFEVIANELRVQRRRVRRDLRLFKHFLEMRGEETGSWRGKIDADGHSGKHNDRHDRSEDDEAQSGAEEDRSGGEEGGGRSPQKAGGRRSSGDSETGGKSRRTADTAGGKSSTSGRSRSAGARQPSSGSAQANGSSRRSAPSSRQRSTERGQPSRGSGAKPTSSRSSGNRRAGAGSR